MATTADIRNGMVIRHNGDLFRIDEYIHRTPGNLRAFVQVKMRNLRNGKIAEERFRSGAELEEVRLETREFQFLYSDNGLLQFMDKETYEQLAVEEKTLGSGSQLLKEGETVQLMIAESNVVGAEMPMNVVLRVIETVPGVRGDTASSASKPAKVETGASINVPLFINEGDLIKVDTRTSQYLERVKE